MLRFGSARGAHIMFPFASARMIFMLAHSLMNNFYSI
jgi:hypothetical protein